VTGRTKPKPPGLDAAWVPTLLKWMARANVWLYRRTGGRVGGSWRLMAGLRKPVPVLLLDHRGRTSGRRLTTPLVYLVDGDRLVVVASSGGLPKDPQWYRNVVADPEVSVQLGREVRRMRARTADAAERAELWPRLVDLYADFASYAAWAAREFPVVVLEPR
jgi:deazaflavin-dependent oxidoreductase (nitroreductase family)